MKIEWKKVTWYSQVAAIIIFVGVFCLGFCLGSFSRESNPTTWRPPTTPPPANMTK